MSTQPQETVRVGIGKYLLKTALFWGIISMIAAILLYIVSFNSLKEGLTATKAVTANSAALLAFAFNLIEIVALVWVFVDEFVGGDDKDTFVDLFVKGVLVFIVLGDVFAIFYDTGYTQNLPGDTFGNILTVGLRAIGAIIGGTGSETFILLGGMILWVWWLNYTGKTIEHHKPSAEAKPAEAKPAEAKPAEDPRFPEAFHIKFDGAAHKAVPSQDPTRRVVYAKDAQAGARPLGWCFATELSPKPTTAPPPPPAH